MVPKGWIKEEVSFFGDVSTGRQRAPSFTEGKLRPYLRVANVFDGYIDASDLNAMMFTDKEFKKHQLRHGDILLNEGQSTELVGRPAMYVGVPEECGFQNTLIRFRANSRAHPEYALQRFRLCLYDGTFQSISKKTTSIAHLGTSRFAELKLAWPPVAEQKKIAKILSTWDHAIAVIENLLRNSQRQKLALAQNLLTGNRRLPGSETPWKHFNLHQIFSRVTTKNNKTSTNVVTISAQHGLVRQEDFFKKTVASEILDNYFLITKGQFAYNKSYSNGYPMGAIKRLNNYEDGVVTTLYICFKVVNETACCSDFFEHFFESGLLNKGLSKIANEGGRAHGLLNVKPSDFFELTVLIPELTEQKKIAKILTAASCEIEILTRKLSCLKREKRALMRELLTGKSRVDIEE